MSFVSAYMRKELRTYWIIVGLYWLFNLIQGVK